MNNISVIILNWLRPNNIKNKIIPQLLKCKLINEIIISHGRQDTYFKLESTDKINIINRKDFNNNHIYGLSLRFICGMTAKNKTILFIDDDQVPHPNTINNMFYIYKKNYPGIIGKYGRIINKNYTYNPNNILNNNRCPIILTSFLFAPKDLCNIFLKEASKIDPFIKKHSKPYWNGEDIFFSLLSIITYKKLPFVANNNNIFPIYQLLTENDTKVAISNSNTHYLYRSLLLKKILNDYSKLLDYI